MAINIAEGVKVPPNSRALCQSSLMKTERHNQTNQKQIPESAFSFILHVRLLEFLSHRDALFSLHPELSELTSRFCLCPLETL